MKKILKILNIFIVSLFFIVLVDFLLGQFLNNEQKAVLNSREHVPYFGYMNLGLMENKQYFDDVNFFKDAEKDDVKVAIFGGSTGQPLSEQYFSDKLSEKLHKKVTVKNFSAAAQIHRQHLHAILELLPKYNPDIVIFYGGFNDLWVGTWADPRPGYPYNFYYVREVPTATKFFVENSAICILLQEKFNLFFSPQKFWKSVFVCTDEWQKIDADKYIETLGLAKKVTETFESKYYGKTRFVAFYQPFQDTDYFEKAQKMVQEKIKGLDYVYDLHNAFDGMGDVYTDICHVKEDSGANEHIIDLMSDITAKKFPLK